MESYDVSKTVLYDLFHKSIRVLVDNSINRQEKDPAEALISALIAKAVTTACCNYARYTVENMYSSVDATVSTDIATWQYLLSKHLLNFIRGEDIAKYAPISADNLVAYCSTLNTCIICDIRLLSKEKINE
jgi:hypothetical protein